jgi:hypothetical protein
LSDGESNPGEALLMTIVSFVTAIILPALATTPAAPADSNASAAWSTAVAHIAGTNRPLHVRKLGGRDYQLDFRKYRIWVTAGRGAAGETIRVAPMHRSSEDRTARPLEAASLVAVAEDNTWFWGVAGDFSFIDVGCCPTPRGLVVYDLARRTRVFESSYIEVGNLVDGRWLSFVEAVAAPPLTPECVGEAKEWLDMGGEIGYEEDVILDLETMRVARSGRIRCSPRQ